MSQPIQRLVPDLPLPPYAYVPGRFPHPTSDPAGHSFGIAPPVPARVEPERWSECRTYLFGIDLFNAGYYWESHVAWESLWLGCGRHGPTADFLKGLIKLAAAGVKALAGNPEGVKSHSCRAAQLWQGVRTSTAMGEVCLGLPINDLIVAAEAICRSGWPEPPPRLIVQR